MEYTSVATRGDKLLLVPTEAVGSENPPCVVWTPSTGVVSRTASVQSVVKFGYWIPIEEGERDRVSLAEDESFETKHPRGKAGRFAKKPGGNRWSEEPWRLAPPKQDTDPLQYSSPEEFAVEYCGFSPETVEKALPWEGADGTPQDNEMLFKATDLYRELRRAEDVWMGGILKAVGRGEIRVRQVLREGYSTLYLSGGPFGDQETKIYASDVHNEIKPLPDVVYHVTTALPGIEESDFELMSQADLKRANKHTVGLGGGPEITLSTTDSLPVAESIYNAMLEVHDVLSGKLTLDDMYRMAIAGDGANEPWAKAWLSQAYYKGAYQDSDGNVPASLPEPMALLLEGKKKSNKEFMGQSVARKNEEDRHWLEDSGDGPWEPVPGEEPLFVGKDGEPVYEQFIQTLSHSSILEEKFRLYKAWLATRDWAGGPENPVFWGSDGAYMESIPKSNIAILKYKNKGNAYGFQPGEPGEWRVWNTDALEYDGVVSRGSLSESNVQVRSERKGGGSIRSKVSGGFPSDNDQMTKESQKPYRKRITIPILPAASIRRMVSGGEPSEADNIRDGYVPTWE